MGAEELTDDGRPAAAPPPPRAGAAARYGDRFRPTPTEPAWAAPVSDTVELDADEPPRAWPPWLARSAAVVGLAATVAVAVAVGDREAPTPDALPDQPPTRSTPLHDPPPVAALDVSRIEADLWESNGFSYEITLTNSSDTAYDLVDVGPAMSGTELAWDRTLVLPAGRSTTVRVDFLVLNCLAATTSSAPMKLRMVVRGHGVDGVAALAQVATADQAAVIEAAGRDICAQGGGDLGGIVLG